MKKRIFIALPLGQELKEKIIGWQKQHHELPARWLKDKNLHITIIPPWYENDMEKVNNELSTLKNSIGPISIQLKKITYGPNPQVKRLIWAEGTPTEKIQLLKTKLETLLNIIPDRKTFIVHVTLAKFRTENFKKFPMKTLNEKIEWQDTVTSFVIMESKLSPQGSDYTVLETYKL